MSIISALPPAPSRSDPATFSDKADALLGALDGFVSETNTVAGEVVTNKNTAVASAATATTQASNASTSASTASTQASNASSSASSASTSASTATTQAGIATTAASTATTQAGIATAAAASINLASPAAIGNVTPNTGAFTTLSATGDQINFNSTSGAFRFKTDAGVEKSAIRLNGDDLIVEDKDGVTRTRVSTAGLAVTGAYSLGTYKIIGSSGGTLQIGDVLNNFTDVSMYTNGGIRATFSSTGVAVTGTLSNTNNAVEIANFIGSGGASNDKRLTVTTGGSSVKLQAYTNSTNAATALILGAGNNDSVTLDASGNLGLGVTPSVWGGGRIGFEIGNVTSLFNDPNGAANFLMNAYWNGSAFLYKVNAVAARYEQSSGHAWHTAPSGTAGNAITFTQAMTLDASGDWMLGKTATGIASVGVVIFKTGALQSTVAGTGFNYHAIYANNSGTEVGSITSTGSTTTYATSSDYRLKNITGPITTSGVYIDRLNPVEGTWKSDGSTFVGLLAHEAQEASRTPVATGVKDGEQMQAMDYSSPEIIANLIAEIQSLRTRVAQLEGI